MAGPGEINERFNAMMGRLNVRERYDGFTEYARNNPLKATFLGVVVATSLFPTLLFLGFITTSLLFGIVGLLFIEGTALTIAVVSLLFVLAGCIATSLTFTSLLVGSVFALRFSRIALKVACERVDECASKWEDKEGAVGQMVKSCRAITGRVCAACATDNKESSEVFEVPEKKD